MQAPELFFEVRKVQREDNHEPRLEVTAGTVHAIVDGRQMATGDILMYLSAGATQLSRISGRMVFPECADMAFEGSLEEMRALWMASGTRVRFLQDPRFAFTRL